MINPKEDIFLLEAYVSTKEKKTSSFSFAHFFDLNFMTTHEIGIPLYVINVYLYSKLHFESTLIKKLNI